MASVAPYSSRIHQQVRGIRKEWQIAIPELRALDDASGARAASVAADGSAVF